MAYATATDDVAPLVQMYITLSVSSLPTLAQVGRWLDETSAKVDVYLNKAGYGTVPATGTNDVLMLRGVVASKVALQTLYVALGADNVPETAKELLSGFAEFLRDIKNGDVVLIDQSPTINNLRVIPARVYGTSSTSSYLSED